MWWGGVAGSICKYDVDELFVSTVIFVYVVCFRISSKFYHWFCSFLFIVDYEGSSTCVGFVFSLNGQGSIIYSLYNML